MVSCASQPARCDGVVGLLGRQKKEVKSGQGWLFDPQPGWGAAWHSGRGTPQPRSPTGALAKQQFLQEGETWGCSKAASHARFRSCLEAAPPMPVELVELAGELAPARTCLLARGLAWGLKPDLGLSIGSPRQKPSKHPSTETRPAQKAACHDVAQTAKPLPQGGLAHLEPVPPWLNRCRSHLLQGACVLCSSLARRNGRRGDKLGWIGISASSKCPPSQADNGLFTLESLPASSS